MFILTDDLSWNLINEQTAPHIMQLEQHGETFDHYFVADSLCCPSRSTIFTGLYPHDTHVATNLPPDGGYQKFQAEGLGKRTFAVALQSGGYATSMLGKYLNGYGDPWGNTGTKVKGNKQNRPAPSSARLSGRARLDRLACRQRHWLRRVQLLAERQRHLSVPPRQGQLRR